MVKILEHQSSPMLSCTDHKYLALTMSPVPWFQTAGIALGWCSPDAHPAPVSLLPLHSKGGGN